MATITVPMQFPEAMAPFIEDEDQVRTFERNAMILYPFIQNLTISHGRAAEILGVHKELEINNFRIIDLQSGISYDTILACQIKIKLL